MGTELSIITVNYNGLDDTCALIDTIPFSNRLEVIVVDNGSTADEASVIQQRYPQVRAIRSEQNLGFAGGNNLGIREATGQYLFFVNNDTVFRSFNLQPLIDRLHASPTIGLVSPKIRFEWDDNPIQFAGYTPLTAVTLRNRAIGYGETDCGQYDSPHPTPYAHGAAMMVSRQALQRVGPMPECYFLYYEELDWSMMFRRAGYDIWYEPAVTIYHKESRSTGIGSPLKAYYITRNRLLFAQRNSSGLQRWATYAYLVLVVALKDTLQHLLRRRTSHARAVWRGVSDFLHNKQYKQQ